MSGADLLWAGSPHLRAAFDLTPILAAARRQLRRDTVGFDTLVGTGLSGALVLPALAREFDVGFVLLRTPGLHRHTSCRTEGFLGSQWLFVDDFIDTGATFRRVHQDINALARRLRRPTTFVGAFLYHRQQRRGPHYLPPLAAWQATSARDRRPARRSPDLPRVRTVRPNTGVDTSPPAERTLTTSLREHR
ncbi:phosphoribosyltransferase [Nocardia sp. NPDC047038]|uniref:phosphoribosyltransferase n=1 Tax=Nocardia sp. NPDC047038 TaxID=3154338 RepID=UPI0033CD379A